MRFDFFVDKIMPPFYRFINNRERTQLWLLLSVQIVLVTLSWYCIEHLLLKDECYQILNEDNYSGSLYIDVPDECKFWTLFWFRINHYTLYTTILFSCYILCVYEISIWHTMTHVYTCLGLLLHYDQTPQQDNIFYCQGPIHLHLLVLVLNLEKQPFEDPEIMIQYGRIREENNERSVAQSQLRLDSQNELICKMRQCNTKAEIEEVVRQVDEQLEKNLLRCQLLDYPALALPKEKKKNILFTLFIHLTLFLLIVLALWNIISLFRPGSIRSFNRKNTTRIL
jgi:hypothetical protein